MLDNKELKEFYNRYRAIIWPIVTGLASLVILVGVIIPQLLTYLDVKSKIGDLQTRVSNLEAKASELQTLDEGQITQQFNSAFTVYPADQEVPSALVILQNLAEQSGLQLASTTYSSGQKTNGRNNYILTLTLDGSITAIRTFLNKLQSAPRVFGVDAISARFNKTDGSSLEVELPIIVYYEPSSKVSWTTEDPLPKLSPQEEKLVNQIIDQVNSKTTQQLDPEASYSAVPIGKLNPFE